MKQLTCEMCGSTDLLKQEGVFVCQTCGTKYSVEEAKKMMIEGTVDVSGSSVKIDNTDSINTYMSMAENAYNASNTAEAEAYCNRVIEIDPQNYDAWMLKGQSAGWQSSLANIRLGEAINCFLNAIQFAPEEPQPIKLDLMGTEVDATVDIRKRLIDKATEEIKNISVALVKLQGDRFAKWPDVDEGNGLLNVVNAICQPVLIYMKAVLTPVDIMPAIATAINNSVMDAWNNIVVPEYINDDDTGHPSDYAFSKLLERAGHCASLLEYAIGLSDDDDESDIIRYKNLIAIHERCISSCSWDYKHETYAASYSLWDGSPNYATKKVWYKNKTLTDSAIANRRASISQYRSKITQCEANVRAKKQREAEEKRRQQEEDRRRKEQEQRERNQAYWAEHAEEKQQLESERNTLQAQLKQLQEQVAPYDREIAKWQKKREADTPAQEEKKTVEKQVSLLRSEQSSLGIFKGKEKKALQAQIDELSSRLPAINESIEAEEKEQIKMCNGKIREIEQQAKPIKDKIAAAEKRINEIKAELTKNR